MNIDNTKAATNVINCLVKYFVFSPYTKNDFILEASSITNNPNTNITTVKNNNDLSILLNILIIFIPSLY